MLCWGQKLDWNGSNIVAEVGLDFEGSNMTDLISDLFISAVPVGSHAYLLYHLYLFTINLSS